MLFSQFVQKMTSQYPQKTEEIRVKAEEIEKRYTPKFKDIFSKSNDLLDLGLSCVLTHEKMINELKQFLELNESCYQ
jgi:hypothetical protein